MSISNIYNSGNQDNENADGYFNSVNSNSVVAATSISAPSVTADALVANVSLVKPFAGALRAALIDVPANTVTVITTYDNVTGSLVDDFSMANGTFTAPIAGLYTFSIDCAVEAHVTADTHRAVGIQVDGAKRGESSMLNIPSTIMHPATSVSLRCDAGAVVRAYVYQNSGVNLDCSEFEFNCIMESI